MERSDGFGALSAINGSKNGSKFGRGEPSAWHAMAVRARRFFRGEQIHSEKPTPPFTAPKPIVQDRRRVAIPCWPSGGMTNFTTELDL